MNTNFFMDCLVAIALIVLLAVGMKVAGVNEPFEGFHVVDVEVFHLDDEGAVWVPRSFFGTDFSGQDIGVDVNGRGNGLADRMELQ